MRKSLIALTIATVLGILACNVIAYAQAAATAPAAAASAPAVVAVGTGIMGWVVAHGGLQAAILMLLVCANTAISAVRTICYKYDGLDLTDDVDPEKYKTLTVVNKIALVVGKLLDIVGSNTQHS